MRKSQFILRNFSKETIDFVKQLDLNNIDIETAKALIDRDVYRNDYVSNFEKNLFRDYNRHIVIKELYEFFLILQNKQIHINIDWLKIDKNNKIFKKQFDKIVSNYNNQSTLNIRTSKSSKLGQFSTPLPISLLFFAWTSYNQGAYPMTIDPYAGNGNLLTFFPKISTYANDIDKLRATILYQTYRENTYSFDGSNLDNWKEFNSLRKFDVVVTNPPFYLIDKTKNEAVNFYGYDIKKFDYKLALISLELMKDNGRAAIIISGSPANIYPLTFWNKYGQYTNGQERNFWFALYQNYNVADVIYINGDKLYKKQGQATNLRLILIDGRKSKSNKSIVPPIFNAQYDKLTNSFTDLYDRIMKTRQNLLGLNMQTTSNSFLNGITSDFNKDIKKFFAHSLNKTFLALGYPSEILTKAGIPNDEIIIKTVTLRNKVNKHFLTQKNLKNLPNKINSPAFIFKSNKIKNAFNIIIYEKTQEGFLTCSLHTNKKINKVEISEIRSIHGRRLSQLSNWLDNNLLLYSKNIHKIKELVRDSGFNSPKSDEFLVKLSAKVSKIYENNKKYLGDLEGPYFPQSKAKRLNVDVPDNMDDEIHKVTKNLAQKVGDIDEYVRRKLQYTTKEELYKALSAEQIDAVALAIYNIEIKELGLIVADQTGIGKGRIAASIMRYARNIGKVPIFLTIKSSLFSDIYRDLNNIGSDDLIPIEEPERDEDGNIIVKYKKNIDEETGEVYLTEKNPKYYKVEHDDCCKKKFVPFIINNNVNIKDSKGNIIYKSSESHKDIPKVEKFDFSGYDCVLATYSQFNFYDGFPPKRNKQFRISTIGKTNRKTWLSELAKDNIVIMDESHEAGGQGNIGYFFKQLIPNTKSTIYLSATYAKYPTSMPIYFSKTALKYTGLNEQSFVDSLVSGGNVFQELISSNLVESGSLIRRERPLKDIIFRFIILDSFGAKKFNVPDKEIEHKFIFDTITKVLRGIIDFQNRFVKPYIAEQNEQLKDQYKNVEDTKGLGVKNPPIFSRLFQIINQVVFSLKAESIGNLAVERLKNGYKPVITFQNTMESLQKDLIKESGNSGNIPSSIKYILKKSFEKVLIYKLTSLNVEYYDEINVEKDIPEAKDDYYKILDNIENLDVDIDISPIDTIKKVISKAGYSIGEMTGRMIELDKISKNTYKVRKRRKENVTDIARKFQNNEIDCVLLNESGSTGISLHATIEGTYLKKNDLMPRVMIMAQPPLNINIFTQMLGRINRSGQLLQPEYDIVSLSVPAEKRLMAMLQGKMASLSANTTADQKSGKNVISVVNFMNKYGDSVAIQWLNENPELDKIMNYPLYTKKRFCKDDDDDCYEYTPENAARKISGRVAVLPIENQDDFYTKVNENYIKLKADLESKGEWDLEISQLNLDAKIISETVIAEGVDNSEPFTSDITLQECDVKVLRKPYSQKELRNFVEKNLNGQTAEEQQDFLTKKYNKYIQKRTNDEIKGINEQYDKKIKKAPDLSSLKKIKKEEGKKIFEEKLKQEISKLILERNEKINKVSQNYELTKNRILGYFQKFKTGYGYDFDTKLTYLDDDGEIIKVVVKAVFLGFKIASDNMIPSNISFKFALAHSKKVKEFKATDSFANELFENVLKYNMSNSGQADTLDKWTKLCKNFTKNRETRYLIVGNVVKAFGSNKYQGELCNAVYSDGKIRKAVFMPEKFNPNAINNSVSISEIVPILEDFSTFSTDEKIGTKTIQNGIVLTKQSSFIWKIELPSSARESARFYKNDTLINLTEEGEFQQIKQGTRWFANVHIVNFPSMLRVLANDFGIEIKLNKHQFKKLKKIKPKEDDKQTDVVKLIEYNVQYEKYENVAGLGNINSDVFIDLPDGKYKGYRKTYNVTLDNGYFYKTQSGIKCPFPQRVEIKVKNKKVESEIFLSDDNLGNIDNEIAESKQMAKEFAKKKNIVTKINFDKIL